MWSALKWTVGITLLVIVALFLHYTLPQRDVVRITNTYNRLTTVGENSIFYATPDVGTAESSTTRDIRFIEAVRPNGKVIVYRNEDTGWIWPPFFKYDSSNLQAKASDMKSSGEAPKWVAITKYGWRIAWLSIYPNAISLRPVDGPNVTFFPWLNITIIVVLVLLVLIIRRMWLQFWERMVDPAVKSVGHTLDDLDASADAARLRARTRWGRFRAWFGSLFRR
ncbi:DUF1523 family protein [Tabrizicola sp. J26]|uniref:DUF1523 family protein n=1 Tax=Alitabrizicola rongguiensis TaxID=2909234 RepID=UPI001F35819B|nr:DUF1523 family protein [Tabrizicola rongguiensis]MCF1707794.1 DUF1523 family protein [Tabrizicola rongguiensis]